MLQHCCQTTLMTNNNNTTHAPSSHNTHSKQQQQKENQTNYASLNNTEAFARYCIDCANEAISLLTTDKMSSSANIASTKTDDSGIGIRIRDRDSDMLGGIVASQEHTWEEIGIRLSPTQQHMMRKKDCWESTKLYCPDYVWADDAMSQCQRLVRALVKHAAVEELIAVSTCMGAGSAKVLVGCSLRGKILKSFGNVMLLLKNDFPLRLQQFRRGIESDVVVSKRLYLIKTEYRAPFRGFLEGHAHVQRAPSLSLVQDYIHLHKWDIKALKERRKLANQRIQDYLTDKNFVEAITIEEKCENLEVDLARMIFPFAELAKLFFDGRTLVPIVEVDGVIDGKEVPLLQEQLKRIRCILCRKTSAGMSKGIRPLLIDLQGIPRDAVTSVRGLNPYYGKNSIDMRLSKLCSQLLCVYELGKSNKLGIEKKEVDGLTSAIKACSGFDGNRFSSLYKQWYELSQKQQQIRITANRGNGARHTGTPLSLEGLSEEIRKAEIEVSIAMASSASLSVVQQRIEHMEKDRLKRFGILKEMVEECCLREMDLAIKLVPPEKECVLELPEIRSAQGIFEPALEIAGEPLPSC